jgi:4-hydroxybenzoate polyprenyltransferase
MSAPSEQATRVQVSDAIPHGDRIVDVLLHASVLDGIVAALKVLTVTILLDLAVTPAVAVGGLVGFAIYASNKLVDDEDEINAPERAAFVDAYRRELAVATAAAVVLALALAATAGTLAFALTVLPGVAAIAYSVELPLTDDRLKDVLGVNNLLVSVSWALPVVALPIVWADGSVTPTAAIVFAFYLAQTVVAFEVRNVRDVPGDRDEGVATVPVVFGIQATRTLLYTIDAVAIACYVAAATTGLLHTAVAGAFVLATLGSIAVTTLVSPTSNGRTCRLRDGNYALVFLVVLVAV